MRDPLTEHRYTSIESPALPVECDETYRQGDVRVNDLGRRFPARAVPARIGVRSMAKAPGKKSKQKTADSYVHPAESVPMRPEIGTQANFRKKKPPKTYRYDSSLSPSMEWDGGTGRAVVDWLLAMVRDAAALPASHAFAKPREFRDAAGTVVSTVSSLQDAVDQLTRVSRPFLNWAGNADVHWKIFNTSRAV
jgi:hypothetical protein